MTENSESAWFIELDSKLAIGMRSDGRMKTVTFSDPAAKRFKQRGDAEFEMQQLAAQFPWMQGRLATVEHIWSAAQAEGKHE